MPTAELRLLRISSRVARADQRPSLFSEPALAGATRLATYRKRRPSPPRRRPPRPAEAPPRAHKSLSAIILSRMRMMGW
jgi:hypothetical protein